MQRNLIGLKRLAVAVLGAALFPSVVLADTCIWTGSWDNTPDSSDDIIIIRSGGNLTWSTPDTVASWTQEDTYTSTVRIDTAYSGAFTELNIAGDCVISNGAWTHSDNSTTETSNLWVSIGGDFVLGPNGVISADGLGYDGSQGPGKATGVADGGGHGGIGGNFSGSGGDLIPTGDTYGSIVSPTNMGSGGQGSGNGGGAARFAVSGATTVDGTITANGIKHPSTHGRHGAGGSVWLTTGTISGSGTIRADGGEGGLYGGGGGGRVSVVVTNSGANFGGFSGAMTAYGGNTPYDGVAGTVYLQTGDQADGTGELIIDNNDHSQRVLTDMTTLMPESVTVHNFSLITITNLGNLGVGADDTLDFGSVTIAVEDRDNASITLFDTTGVSFPSTYSISNYTLVMGDVVTATGTWIVTSAGRLSHLDNDDAEQYKIDIDLTGSLTVASGGEINVDGLGYDASQGPGKATGLADGGGHGGIGGNYDDDPTGGTYGSIFAPTNFGSGAEGGSGGGAVRFAVSGATTVDGTITANGTAANSVGRHGAGGSVWLTTGTISGSGTIRADGGDEESKGQNFGAGGGGRVSVVVTNSGADFSGFSGAMTAYGGNNSYDGAAGTVYRQTGDEADGTGWVTVDNSGRAPAAGVVTELPPSVDQVTNETEYAGLILTNANTTLALTTNAFLGDIRTYADTTLDLNFHTLSVNRFMVDDSPTDGIDDYLLGSTNNAGTIVWLQPPSGTVGTVITIR